MDSTVAGAGGIYPQLGSLNILDIPHPVGEWNVTACLPSADSLNGE